MKKIDNDDLSGAIGDLNFDTMLLMFSGVGVPPGQAESSCAEWLSDLLTIPLVDLLRNEDIETSLPAAMALLSPLLQECEKEFARIAPMTPLLASLRALGVVMETAAARGALPHTPSALRAAWNTLKDTTQPSGGPGPRPFDLAITFGALGRHLIQVARSRLATCAHDGVARANFEKCIQGLRSFEREQAEETAEYDTEVLLGILRDLESCVKMMGQPLREELFQSITTAFTDFQKIMEAWEAQLQGDVGRKVQGGLRSFLEVVGSFVAGQESQKQVENGGEHAGDDPDLEALEALLEVLDGEIMSEWSRLQVVADLLDRVEINIDGYLKEASLECDISGTTAIAMDRYALLADGMASLKQILQSSRCVMMPQNTWVYNDLLKSWSTWNDLCDDDKGEVEVPALEAIVRGVKAVRRAAAVMEKRAEAHTPIDIALRDALESCVPTYYTNRIGALVGDSMAASQAESKVTMCCLQEPATLIRCCSEGRLATCVGLLLGGVTANGKKDGLEKMKEVMLKVLASNDWQLPEKFQWPHAAAFEMTDLCLGLFLQIVGDEVAFGAVLSTCSYSKWCHTPGTRLKQKDGYAAPTCSGKLLWAHPLGTSDQHL